MGPLGTKEKDVTLRWARMVAQELKRRGAIAILTRDTDVDVPLHERVAIARRNRADMLISLHANALPEGMNPFTKHGTGTYYYQPQSHEAAKILHKRLLQASGLSDDGIYDANFAVVRPTDFPSVLLEAAYLMYPAEEKLLRSETYLHRLAKGVVKGLAEYFKRKS
jgi:N-acetylmuramoyl-L-alanine amidase